MGKAPGFSIQGKLLEANRSEIGVGRPSDASSGNQGVEVAVGPRGSGIRSGIVDRMKKVAILCLGLPMPQSSRSK